MAQQDEKMNEEQKTLNEEGSKAYLSVYNRIPYALIREKSGEDATEVFEEIREICMYYKIYKRGKDFNVEGTNGDYTPARLRYKMAATLVNKEARFLFAEQPDITIEQKGDLEEFTEESKKALTVMNELLQTILDKNNFQDILIKGARDCFIGKRVACLINFNEQDGVTLTFLPSTQFLYEVRPTNHRVLEKFVCFTVMKESKTNSIKRIFKKKYTLEQVNGVEKVFLEEEIFDGAAKSIEKVTEKCEIKLDFIPAIVFINDGLSEELKGESEIESLMDFEEWYSKLGNADADAERKSMNPTKYLVDMANNSTKNLSTAAGALWDLGSDQNLDNPYVQVGLLEPQMYYSEALKTTLDRIKTTGYEQVDMPNITNESLSGVITSGKALKAIYWPLIVRCKEKMKMWGPNLSLMAEMIIQGAMIYPNTIKKYTSDILMPIEHVIEVVQNTPLPEDEIEEKTIDLAEVEAKTMSRKTFMKKWRGLTKSQIAEELNQIALERQIIEDASFGGTTSNGMNGDNSLINNLGKDDFKSAGENALTRDGTQGQTGGGQQQTQIQQVMQSQQTSSAMSKLNGTQIGSLISILGGYKAGNFTRNQAKRLIMSMGLDDTFAEALLDEEKKPGVIANV